MTYILTAIIGFSLGVISVELTILHCSELDNRRRNDAAARRQAIRAMRKGMAEMWGRK
jgi:hypothetical protein